MKGIKKVCQLVGRCDGHGGDVMRLWEDVTVVRRCDSPQGGLRYVRNLCQLIGVILMGEVYRSLRRCASCHTNVTAIREV